VKKWNISTVDECVYINFSTIVLEFRKQPLEQLRSPLNEQELSYRKQIARQLRTQYVEGIYKYDNPVTLKSRLTVTQGHWKRNH